MYVPEFFAFLALIFIIMWAIKGCRRDRHGSRRGSRKSRERDYEAELSVKDKQINELRERVEVLERIITDPRRDLKEQFNDIA